MPRGSGTNHHYECDIDKDKLIAALKKRDDLSADELLEKMAAIQKHKKHYNGTFRLSKKQDRKEFFRMRYCPKVRMKTKNKPSSQIRHSSS